MLLLLLGILRRSLSVQSGVVGREVGAVDCGCNIQPISVDILVVLFISMSWVGRRAVSSKKYSPSSDCALGLGTQAEFPLDGMRLYVLGCPCTEQFLGSMLKLEEIRENGTLLLADHFDEEERRKKKKKKKKRKRYSG